MVRPQLYTDTHTYIYINETPLVIIITSSTYLYSIRLSLLKIKSSFLLKFRRIIQI